MYFHEMYVATKYPHIELPILTSIQVATPSDSSQKRPHTSLGHYSRPSPPATPPPSMGVAHKNHRGKMGVNDSAIADRRSRSRSECKGKHQAGHTKTSLLRLASQGETHGWMLPETKEFMEKQINKSMEAYQDIMRLKAEKKKKPKKKRKSINTLDVPNATWLKKNGLIARKLTVMDVLTPTVVRVSPKYIPVLDTHVVSKVFNDVLPIAHVSPRSRREVRLVNPAAVNLPGYDEKVKIAIDQFQQRLDLQVWRKLSQEEREKFKNGPVSYMNNTDSIHQAFDRLGWPIPQYELQLLVDEIHLGERYLQQSQDLQRTSKKVAMGRRKSDASSTVTSQRSHSYDDRSQSSISDGPDEKPPKPTTVKRSVIDRLKGQKVIARDDIDGLYYSGTVLKCTDARHAQIEFKHGDEVNVPIRFVIPRSGAVSCPPLKIGDHVLGLTRNDNNMSCYAPGIVIGTPLRSQIRDKFYTVLRYDNTKLSLLRNKIVKISEVRYAFVVRYIQHASQIDPTVPSVDFVRAVTPEKEEPPITKDDVDDIRGTLQGLQMLLDDNSREQQEQREMLVRQSHDIEDTRNEIKGLAVTEAEREHKLETLKKRETSTNTDPMLREMSTNTDPLTPDTPSPMPSGTSTMTAVTPIDEPETAVETPQTAVRVTPESDGSTTPDSVETGSPQTVVAIDDKKGSVMVIREDKGVHVARSPPEVISRATALVRELSPKLHPGQEVLARCNDDGWYYRGTIQSAHGDDSYDIVDCTGLVQQTYREDIITDEDDAENVIKEKSTLVALHPSFPHSYAPAYAVECQPNQWFNVCFYDRTEANVPREEVYLIHPDKHKLDVDFITDCEKKWIGEAVVARSDMDGQYHLASCRMRVGNGHQYVLQWADGSSSTQHLSCMFGAFTRKRPLKISDCVLALYDNEELVYLPGRVMAMNGDKLVVNFCNRTRSNHVSPSQCFWISKLYHDLAVAFYNSKETARPKS